MWLTQRRNFLLSVALALLAIVAVSAPLNHLRVVAAAELPECPPRPKDHSIPWPPYPCREVRPPSKSSPRADIWLRLTAEPSSSVAAGATVRYQLIAHNGGRESASTVRATLPFRPDAQTLVEARFSDPGAWVRAVLTDTIEMNLGQLGSGGTITATLLLRTAGSTPLGADLSARGRVAWNTRGGQALSNRVSLTLARANASSLGAPLAITPGEGSAGAKFAVEDDRFASNEPVALWYDSPGGRSAALGETQADAQGRIYFLFSVGGLAGGTYRLVAYGQRSEARAVGVFTVAGVHPTSTPAP